MAEREDKFWDRDSDREREKSLATWPGAFAAVARQLIFWVAVIAVVYLLVSRA